MHLYSNQKLWINDFYFYIDNILIFIKTEIIINVIQNNTKIIFKMKNFDSINKILDI